MAAVQHNKGEVGIIHHPPTHPPMEMDSWSTTFTLRLLPKLLQVLFVSPSVSQGAIPSQRHLACYLDKTPHGKPRKIPKQQDLWGRGRGVRQAIPIGSSPLRKFHKARTAAGPGHELTTRMGYLKSPLHLRIIRQRAW